MATGETGHPPVAQCGIAFRKPAHRKLGWVYLIQTERVVAKDAAAIRTQWWRLTRLTGAARWRARPSQSISTRTIRSRFAPILTRAPLRLWCGAILRVGNHLRRYVPTA